MMIANNFRIFSKVKILLNIKTHQKILLVTGGLLMLCILFLKCMGDGPVAAADPRGSAFAGAAACTSCHTDISNHYLHTNHYKTSETFSYHKFRQLIKAETQSVSYSNGQMVRIENNGNDVFQTLYHSDNKQQSERLDISFGSGDKAQTYGYWKENELYQLPLTYRTDTAIWTNSPGFPVDRPYYTRAIPIRCLECHTSYAYAEKVQTGPLELSEKIRPASIVFGIDCERCHGPAMKHVQFHQSHPDDTLAKHITPVNLLTRQQQLDMCATCHSGDPLSLQSVFAFQPGDTLSKYYMYYTGATGEPDVHGKQLQLLQMSECFQQSTLTCTTCHDPHKPLNRQLQIQRCLSCHQQPKHPPAMDMATQDCITCHMPLRSSRGLDFRSPHGKEIPYRLRTHRIAVYPASEWR